MRNLRLGAWIAFVGALLAASLSTSPAIACSYPFHTLTNGSTADANQVMDNFNYVLTCGPTPGTTSLALNPGPLTIDGAASAYAYETITSHGGAGNGYGANAHFVNTDGIEAQLNMSDSGDGTAYYTENGMWTMSVGSGFGIKINSNGTDNNGLRVETYGIVICTVGCVVTSDRRLKTKIEDLQQAEGLTAIDALKPVKFYWKDSTRPRGQQIGLIAQDVQNVFPQAVIKSSVKTKDAPDGVLGLNYDALAAPIILSIQQLDARTRAQTSQEQRVASLEKQNQELTTQVQALKTQVSALANNLRAGNAK